MQILDYAKKTLLFLAALKNFNILLVLYLLEQEKQINDLWKISGTFLIKNQATNLCWTLRSSYFVNFFRVKIEDIRTQLLNCCKRRIDLH